MIIHHTPSPFFNHVKLKFLHFHRESMCIKKHFVSIHSVATNVFFAGTDKITESFLYPVGQLAVDPRIYILIQKEV